MKKALVLGAGGFIGTHLVSRLKSEGFWVRGVDIKNPEFSETDADEFIIGDLRDPDVVARVVFAPMQISLSDKEQSFDEVYQLAADMGGAEKIFTGTSDADIMHNSGLININVAKASVKASIKKIFYSSTACIYPKHIQEDPNNAGLKESDAYPANPDSPYGFEKIFSEILYEAYNRNYQLEIRMARFHNIYGTLSSWKGDRAKSPAAICRKVAETPDGGEMEIFGDGEQTRSFLYIESCLDGIRRLMDSDFILPINIGSDEMISINKLAYMVMNFANKEIKIKHIEGPLGVRGRNSNNDLIFKELGWKPHTPSLEEGMKKLYTWVNSQVEKDKLK